MVCLKMSVVQEMTIKISFYHKINIFIFTTIQNTNLFIRATGPVLTSDKEEKHVILPTTLNFDVRRGKLRIYTLQNPPEVF